MSGEGKYELRESLKDFVIIVGGVISIFVSLMFFIQFLFGTGPLPITIFLISSIVISTIFILIYLFGRMRLRRLYKKQTSSTVPRHQIPYGILVGENHRMRKIFIIYILPALIGAAATITATIITISSQTYTNVSMVRVEHMGEITHPREGDVVEQVFVVRGSLTNVDMDQYYWVAVQAGNLYWPKEPRVLSREGDWEISVIEPVQNRPFSLVLFVVEEKGNNEIENWFRQGREKGHYPGLANIPGGKILDVVENVMVR